MKEFSFYNDERVPVFKVKVFKKHFEVFERTKANDGSLYGWERIYESKYQKLFDGVDTLRGKNNNTLLFEISDHPDLGIKYEWVSKAGVFQFMAIEDEILAFITPSGSDPYAVGANYTYLLTHKKRIDNIFRNEELNPCAGYAQDNYIKTDPKYDDFICSWVKVFRTDFDNVGITVKELVERVPEVVANPSVEIPKPIEVPKPIVRRRNRTSQE